MNKLNNLNKGKRESERKSVFSLFFFILNFHSFKILSLKLVSIHEFNLISINLILMKI